MGYWLKRYADSTSYRGSDMQVNAGVSTWSGSRSTGMVGVDLLHHAMFMSIDGAGDYWQSDTFESVLGSNRPTLVQRRIERQIQPTDRFFKVKNTGQLFQVTFNDQNAEGKYMMVPRRWYGHWLIVEYDLATKRARFYVKEARV